MSRRAERARRELAAAPPAAVVETIRLDRWLCHARVFKTRSLAADRIAAGGIRVNGVPCRKPGQELRPGDVVTAAVPGGVRSLRMRAPGARRGPPAEARLLYDDLDAPAEDGAPGAPWPDEDED